MSIVFPGQTLPPPGPNITAIPGPGTHVSPTGEVCASVVGVFTSSPAGLATQTASSHIQAPLGAKTQAQSVIYSVHATTTRPDAPARRRPVVPAVNSIILGRVMRLSRTQASVSILAVETEVPDTASLSPADLPATTLTAADPAVPVAAAPLATCRRFVPCQTPFPALLRTQDLRATEKDKQKLAECVHVGDIIRAIVISLGDQAAYYLSTGRNDLGVIMAWTSPDLSPDAVEVCESRSTVAEQLLPISWREMMAAGSGRREARKVAKPI